jgi:hypothetical protein
MLDFHTLAFDSNWRYLTEMNLPPEDLLGRARRVIAAESGAVQSVTESLDQNFVAVAEVLLAYTGKVLITGSGTSGTIAMRAAHLFSVGGTPAFYLSPSDGLQWRPPRPEKRWHGHSTRIGRGYSWREFFFTHPSGAVGKDAEQALHRLNQEESRGWRGKIGIARLQTT